MISFKNIYIYIYIIIGEDWNNWKRNNKYKRRAWGAGNE